MSCKNFSRRMLRSRIDPRVGCRSSLMVVGKGPSSPRTCERPLTTPMTARYNRIYIPSVHGHDCPERGSFLCRLCSAADRKLWPET